MILEQIKTHLQAAEKHLAASTEIKAAADAAKRCADAPIADLDEGEKALLEAWQIADAVTKKDAPATGAKAEPY